MSKRDMLMRIPVLWQAGPRLTEAETNEIRYGFKRLPEPFEVRARQDAAQVAHDAQMAANRAATVAHDAQVTQSARDIEAGLARVERLGVDLAASQAQRATAAALATQERRLSDAAASSLASRGGRLRAPVGGRSIFSRVDNPHGRGGDLMMV